MDGDTVVVQQAADQCPAVIVLDGGSVAAPAELIGNFDVAGVVIAVGPEQERPSLPVASRVFCQPAIDVALSAVGKRGAVVAQPGNERDGGTNLGSRVVCFAQQ
jgi:hypothetical protein